MKKSLKAHRLAVVAAAALLLLVAGGIAYATIPDSSGVIHGCILLKQNNVLKVIDTDAGQTCPSGTQPLNWNQTGPQGPQGIQGPQGPTGPQGPAGVAPAYARVNGDGTVNPDLSKNVSDANVSRPQTGVYCIGGLTVDGAAFNPKVATANAPAGFVFDSSTGTFKPAQPWLVMVTGIGNLPNTTLAMCPDTAKVRVETYAPDQQAFVDRGFSIIFEG